MAEAVLLAVTKIGCILGDEVIKAIISELSVKVTNLKELPVKVEQIRKQLTMMSNVIMQIDTVYLIDKGVKNWIGEVRNVAYHVEDVMDKYSYHILKHREQSRLKKILKIKDYAVFSQIVDEVVVVEEEIEQVIKLKERWLQPFQLVPGPLTEMERRWSQDSFPEFVKDQDLVGIEENRILLTRWLDTEETENNVITVSGMGGLGKSTLVSNVYEREKIKFPANAWIVVSQIYTVDALLRKILWKIGYTEKPLSAGMDKMDIYDMKKEIEKRLENRKYLIVLDDVWEPEVYFQISDAFPNLQGSRIIITTRKDHVAGISSPTRHLELLPLSNPDAFKLFCRKAFHNMKDHTCPEDLETTATSIVEKCHGLPLAIVTIGSMLSSRQKLDVYKQTYNQLGHELSNNDHVRAILNLSYHDLSDDLRNCFLYCSLFPEDYPMSRDTLVRLWVAEGFVPSKGKNTPEMVAEGNLMELVHRNMLEVVEYDELGRVSVCKMHDIMRELASSVAKEERFASTDDYDTMMDIRRLSSCEWKEDTALKAKLSHLRTVVSVIPSSPDMLSSILSASNYLTVLELQDSEITEVPKSIGSQFNLRYIGLRRTKVKALPDTIEHLSRLHTLDIKQTKIEKLPRGLFKIKKLQHLFADRFVDEKQVEFRYFNGMQAPKELSNLQELQTLETVESSNDLAEQLKKLTQLRSLWDPLEMLAQHMPN
uniref:Disease resistance protein RPM1 n=1 Tax=Aegilops tauschii subsp. strangulata TaxID=200361 RepID=A0A453D1S6_AEGTS